MKRDPRYTSNTIFDTFPWPQEPSVKDMNKVAAAAVEVRKQRRALLASLGKTLREMYRDLEKPGEHPLRSAQSELDLAVRSAYGMKAKDDAIRFILQLNADVAGQEQEGKTVTGPGLPQDGVTARRLTTADCLQPDGTFAE